MTDVSAAISILEDGELKEARDFSTSAETGDDPNVAMSAIMTAMMQWLSIKRRDVNMEDKMDKKDKFLPNDDDDAGIGFS